MSTTQTIRAIMAEQPNSVQVFERFQIDLCSQADLSLREACHDLQLSCDQVIERLEEARTAGNSSVTPDPSGWTLNRLTQHIVRVHHRNTRRELPQLARMAHKLASKRGDRAPVLKHIERLSNQLLDQELAHLHREEQELFPPIARMEEDLAVVLHQPDSCLTAVSKSIRRMLLDHEASLGIMADIRGLTNDFSAPEWACLTHRALLDGWRAFEKDLDQHIHLENDHLFPRAMQMGRELSVGK